MRYVSHRKKVSVFPFVICVLLIFIITFIIKIVRPVVMVFAETTAVNHATKNVNETVESYLQSMNIRYSDVAQIQSDSNGGVTAVRIDSIALNQIKTGVTAKVAESFADIQTAQLQIPIGTLSGSNLFAGKGVSVPLYVSYSASAESELSNLFVTRGINQTLHRIVLQVSVRVKVLTYGKTKTNEIKTQITVAETVIVGTIPEIYAGANDELWPNLVE